MNEWSNVFDGPLDDTTTNGTQPLPDPFANNPFITGQSDYPDPGPADDTY